MALTIAGSEIDAWALNATNTVRIGATVDVSDSYQSILHIDMALGTDATPHIGTRVLVQCSSSSADNEFWTERMDFIALVGTANTEAITNNPLAAAETSITVASTTGYVPGAADVPTLLCLLIDNTVANSELVRIVSYVSNTSVECMEGVKREHANTAVLTNVAATYSAELPLGTVRARVIYDNEYDTVGSGIYTRTRITKTTAL